MRSRRPTALAEGVRRAGGEPLPCALADGGRGNAGRRLRGRRGQAASRSMRATRSGARGARRSATAAAARSWSRRPRPSASACWRPRERDPRRTGSAGLADLLRAALERGATRVLVGLGGSATVDGGLGLLAGLGARVPGETGGALLGELELDLAPARAPCWPASSSASCTTSTCRSAGPMAQLPCSGRRRGCAARTSSPSTARWPVSDEAFGGDVAQRPGAGAAGGLGAALYALGADSRSGCEAVIELVGLRGLARRARRSASRRRARSTARARAARRSPACSPPAATRACPASSSAAG